NTSILTADYNPPIPLGNDEWVMGLTNFEAFNSVPNVTEANNTLKFGNKTISVPTGSYELSDIQQYINSQLNPTSYKFVKLTANTNTLKTVIKGTFDIDFNVENSIGGLLGYKRRRLEANVDHESDYPTNILTVNSLLIYCNITTGNYVNGAPGHIIHQFFPSVTPGHKIVESPDHDGDLVNFRGETVTVGLHLKRVRNGVPLKTLSASWLREEPQGYIYFKIRTSEELPARKEPTKVLINWEVFRTEVQRRVEGLGANEKTCHKKCTEIIKSAHKKATRVHNGRVCIERSREITRLPRDVDGGDDTMLDEYRARYKTAKKELRRLINKSKRAHWNQLFEDIENDIWSSGYGIAMKDCQDTFQYRQTMQVTGYSKARERGAVQRGGTSGGPKKHQAQMGSRPRSAKILSRVERSQGCPNTQGGEKPATERVIQIYLLVAEIEVCGGFAKMQFGFRKGRSTIQAIDKVKSLMREERQLWSALITIDVKNAFNTADWNIIIEKLLGRQVSAYLVILIREYLRDRKIRIDGRTKMYINAGVPQGSVLGPTLWNLLYDGVLRMGLPRGVTTVGFADDLALVEGMFNTPEEEIFDLMEERWSNNSYQASAMAYGSIKQETVNSDIVLITDCKEDGKSPLISRGYTPKSKA
ncbi:hypothetical protein ILUMI_03403, partial [Ignelater luminosus]